MACTPYDPETGLFINTLNWGTTGGGPWSFGHDRDQGGFAVYALEQGGTIEDELFLPTGTAVRWIFFEDNSFLAVRSADTSGSTTTYEIHVYDLRSGVDRYELGGGPYTASGGTPQLRFQPSQDGTAFFVFIGGDSGPNTTHTHKVFRTATGDSLCSWGSITETAGRHAEITDAGTVRIQTSPGPGGETVYRECDLPAGELEVTPATRTFPEAVVGGPPGTSETTGTFDLENVGDDCLVVDAIGDVDPFSVTSTSQSLPAELDAGDSMTVTVTFDPPSTGSYGPTNLPVTRTPDAGDDALVCEGTARDPVVSLTVGPGSIDFGRVPVGTTETESLAIENDGETDVDVTVDASASGPITWPAMNETLDPGDDASLTVTFEPGDPGPASATVTVESDDPDSPETVAVDGEGCVAEAAIEFPPSTPVDFGEVERGFRTVRTLTVRNDGSGPLEFDARVDGADASLFGLQPPAGDVVDVSSTRHYAVDPTAANACGPVATGSGETILGVAFHADRPPGTVTAELTVHNHNATNGVPSEWTVPLTAEVVPTASVDAGLVLDRSGSMDDLLGSRRKFHAAVRAGKLFSRLMRSDVGDRETVVRYNDAPDVLQAMTEVGGDGTPRQDIVDTITETALSPSGTTAIAGGVLEALDELATPRADSPPELRKALVVLTDGKDNTAYQDPDDGQWYSLVGGEVAAPDGSQVMTDPLPDPGDVKTYGVGLGREEDVDKGRLNQLSTATGAYFGVVGDMTGETYFDLEKYFTAIFMETAGMEGVVDPVYTATPGDEHAHEFDVLRGDVSALVVLYDEEEGRLPFHLVSPAGERVEPGVVPPGFQLRHGATETARFVELRMPAGEPDRYAGRWSVVVTHDGRICVGDPTGRVDDPDFEARNPDRVDREPDDDEAERLPWSRGYLPRKCRQTDDPVDYGVAIGVGSNLRMQPYLTPEPVSVGDPIRLSATVTEAGLPVTGCDVTVTAVSPSGQEWTEILHDDGGHGDGDPDDAEYAHEFTRTAEAGSYEFTFRATGRSRDGEPVSREAVRSKYVEGRVPVGRDEGDTGDLTDRLADCCDRLTTYLRAGVVLLVVLVVILLALFAGVGPFG